jgi:ArsR family transcriptional regulator, lead/cadmium/zinc/bismuth-responsive transcriptional repressor
MISSIFLFKALGEETKHKILRTLLDGEICACEIPLKIGRTQSNTSMHLAKLIEWNLIKSKRKGKMILYSLKDKRIINIFKIMEKGGEK